MLRRPAERDAEPENLVGSISASDRIGNESRPRTRQDRHRFELRERDSVDRHGQTRIDRLSSGEAMDA